MESIDRFEKYRDAYQWCLRQNTAGGRMAVQDIRAFSQWFVYSDWDDPRAALAEWRGVLI